MAVSSRFIPNSEATPLVDTTIFDDREEEKYALVTLGKGLQKDDPLTFKKTILLLGVTCN